MTSSDGIQTRLLSMHRDVDFEMVLMDEERDYVEKTIG